MTNSGVWAVTAGLFIVAAAVFAIVERQKRGARSVLRLPRARALLNWLVPAMALLAALTLGRRRKYENDSHKAATTAVDDYRLFTPV